LLNTILASLSEGVAPSTNSYESIATVTVGSGGAANVEFTSIPSTYSHLQVRVFAQTNRATFGRDMVKLNVNTDTGNNYSHHYILGDGGSAIAGAASTTNKIDLGEVGTGVGSTFGIIILDLLDYTNTNKYKTIRSLFGGDHNGTIASFGGTVGLFSGLWQSTSAITSLKFAPVNGAQFNQYSHFALYGIKGA
jgi:hypothetical protein